MSREKKKCGYAFMHGEGERERGKTRQLEERMVQSGDQRNAYAASVAVKWDGLLNVPFGYSVVPTRLNRIGLGKCPGPPMGAGIARRRRRRRGKTKMGLTVRVCD